MAICPLMFFHLLCKCHQQQCACQAVWPLSYICICIYPLKINSWRARCHGHRAGNIGAALASMT